MAELKILVFQDTHVPFVIGSKMVLVCLNGISRTFPRARRPSRWLATSKAKKMIGEISITKKIRPDALVIVRRGGIIQGTWMYSDIAVAYVNWLLPEFGKWCAERIQDLRQDNISGT